MTPEIFQHIENLYTQMDKEWSNIADKYSFQCNGCEDNCCQSLFFHYTYIEKAYFMYGFNKLDPYIKKEILILANDYFKKTFKQSENITSLKIYCPVNKNTKCLLYTFRPMICRLHGLPHELTSPGVGLVKSPGCNAGIFNDKPYIKFDRTPFYQAMAQIELEFRSKINKTGRSKQTIAQILLDTDIT